MLRIVWRIGALLLLPALVLALLSLFSRRPAGLGATQGLLAECPNRPSCVSSQTSRAARRVEPIPFAGSAEEALDVLRRVLGGLSNTRIVTDGEGYVHAECTSRVFRFVDDLEFLIDRDRRVIHCRSASRVGYYDFGVNRRRIEEIRRRMLGSS
ncbi:MAG TPA: DUF1499 domain-containing protein [Pirellulales bacterium]|jgi:uncharacterized protein (DUF1499 family)|nr:DUF1499 domain-containing protein [Pirellulales bacterium]